jgi:uncharacterized protein YuzE
LLYLQQNLLNRMIRIKHIYGGNLFEQVDKATAFTLENIKFIRQKGTIEKYLLKMPSNRIWIDYDEDADVLYVSFQKPQHADDSEMKDNIIYHYRDKDLVGITVVGAKKYGEYGQ